MEAVLALIMIVVMFSVSTEVLKQGRLDNAEPFKYDGRYYQCEPVDSMNKKLEAIKTIEKELIKDE